ncbi:MAG TPA: ROK family protein [Ornithinibacter sp.]|nr:ROK family protein [Ornithinibacter sp.]
MSLKLRDRAVPRRASLDALLTHAWSEDVVTAATAMDAVGLARSTTIEGIDGLVALGLLRELPNARAVGDYRKGRPSRRFELCADAAVVVGVDAGRSHLVTTVADLRGVPIITRTTDTAVPADAPVGAGDSADIRRHVIAAAVDAALAEAGRARPDVLAVCVGVPAPVDRHGRSPVHRDGFWQRMNPDLKDLFSTWAPIVRVENDATLASVAEHARGAAVGLRDTVTLLAGERLGAGVVVDGRLLRGAHGGVGEVVVLRRLKGVKDVPGLAYMLVARAREQIGAGALPVGHPLRELGRDAVTAPDVVELARSGDPQAQAIVEEVGRVLARIAGVFCSLFDPERIVIAGGAANGLDGVIDVARRRLPQELDLPAAEIVASSLGADVVSIGAVAAAVEAARDGALHIA